MNFIFFKHFYLNLLLLKVTAKLIFIPSEKNISDVPN